MAAATWSVPLHTPLFRGERRLRLALVGMPNAGKSTLFKAVSSTAPQSSRLAGMARAYDECTVQIGLDEAAVMDLPSFFTLQYLSAEDLKELEDLDLSDLEPKAEAK